jgi:PAS domain S-box-containing protein
MMPVPCWYSDSNTLILKGANSEALKLFGYTEEEFIGMSAVGLISPIDRSRIDGIRAAEKWGAVGSFTFLRKDGSEFKASIRWHQGEYHGTLCDYTIVTGITSMGTSPDSSFEGTYECGASY